MDPGVRLMDRIRARDVSAFEALYDGYHRLVFGIALRMLGDLGAAEDVTQTVFMKIWTAPEAFRGGSFTAWVSRVARNRALDVLRSRSLRPETELPAELPLDGGLDEDVFARIDAERVRDALATLPAEQRALIELGFFGGITHQELARRTETPLGTVKTRVRSGLRKLRDALGEGVSR
ncbi:MAG TPA: sigma-70 family RNA polymerase sigma factor [Candidatus Elarobacter sp.]|jgi:RNA polymerase sigma-70 factor (ECF subfamily)